MKKLFDDAIRKIDRYTKSVEMDFPDDFVVECKAEMEEKLAEIKAAGAEKDFEEYVLTA